MVNRNTAPVLNHVEHYPIHQPQKVVFGNGQEVHLLRIGDQEVIRLDMLFEAGKWQQEVPLSANFVAGLLKEGTADYSSRAISELLDGTGAYLQVSAGMHHTTLSLFSLNKHFNKLLPLLESILFNPAFEEKEIENYRNNRLQKFLKESGKVNVLAAQYFKAHVFGEHHPYGFFTTTNHYKDITRKDVKLYYSKHLMQAPVQILLTGHITDEVLAGVERFLGKRLLPTEGKNNTEKVLHPQKNKVFHFDKPDAVQTAIQMGVPTISKTHPDFCPFLILNTILGGYFGSRLMRNIREEKGYTYGIGSALVPYLHAGIFTVYTQTDNAFKNAVIDEIYKEVELLKTHSVSKAELEMVKNYLRGDLIRNMDHPFQMAETLHALMEFNLNVDFIQSYLHTINTITPEKLQHVAQTYFKDDYHLVTAGGK